MPNVMKQYSDAFLGIAAGVLQDHPRELALLQAAGHLDDGQNNYTYYATEMEREVSAF